MRFCDECIELAAAQGNNEARYRLASLYHEGLCGKDLKKAKELYELAINDGFVPAQYGLGKLEQHQNQLEEAVRWYQMAAEHGFEPAD